jgi:hypothetical protein
MGFLSIFTSLRALLMGGLTIAHPRLGHADARPWYASIADLHFRLGADPVIRRCSMGCVENFD